MKLDKENLNLETGLQKEWIITNGIGGYASSTIIGANTRRYHGLLVAPIAPPAKRQLILSKLDETIEIAGKRYDLYTNIGKEYISHGYKNMESFTKEILPIFKYKIKDVEISKNICMEYGKNTVQVFYKIKNGKSRSKLTLAPIINFRDFHDMTTGKQFKLKQEQKDNKIKIVVDDNVSYPIYMKISEGNYIEHYNDTFYNMFYIEEEKRGFYPEENHVVSGRFEINIEPKEEKEISFVCSLEENIDEIEPKKLISDEIIRQSELYNKSLLIDNKNQNKTKKELEKDELTRTFLTAIDNFIVYRPTFGLHTVIAGYPWFLDWGRDTLIAFEGLFLKTKRFEEAREVLLTITRDIKYGLVPNGYSEVDNSPLYNSVDSSLLLFEQVKKYIDYTEDNKFIKESIYPKLKKIIENYASGISFGDNNIHLEEDGLISSGTENTQNTWMDAKYKGFAATPRNGKAVEINALWYNALKIMAELSKRYLKIGKRIESKKYEDMAEVCKESFEKEFYNAKRKCLYDVVGDKKIRPNQLFALSLTYPVIEPTSEMADNIIATVEKKLLNSYGLKTLAKGEENFIETYEGDSFKRDMSYHQGPTWVWLLGLYYNCLVNKKLATTDKKKNKEISEKIETFKNKVERTFKKELYERGCIGSIAELYDSKTPFLPKGTIAQAWSVAEVFRIIY
ncbi:MAG: glycogen debranching protein [Clostridia bacterium]|nr:glycogen debranching protein [Clostridia bacterium]